MAKSPTQCLQCGAERTVYQRERRRRFVCLPCVSEYLKGRRKSYHIQHNRRKPRKIEDVWQSGGLADECDAAVEHANRINALQAQLEREPRADLRAEIKAKMAAAVEAYDRQHGKEAE